MSRVALILTPGFADWEYGALAGAGRAFLGLETRFFGPEGAVSMGGLQVTGLAEMDTLADWQPRVTAVIGGTAWEGDDAPDIAALLSGLHEDGTWVAAICGGTLAAARAGLLDDRDHTSNAPDYLTRYARGYGGADRYLDRPAAVTDDRVVTAPGSAPVSFAAAVFAAAGVPADQIAQFRTMMASEF